MSRPQLEVADIIRSAGRDFVARNRSWLRWTHLKVLLAIARCRTAALGGHIDECTSCGYRATISYNSCRNRHCPKCQTGARERWIAARCRELLPTPYVHVVFTLPPCCHGASPLSTPLHRKTKQKLRPLLRTRGGAVPNAADRWSSSNDSPPHNSNSVLHRSWPPLHEITRPHTALLARFRASRRSVSRSHPDISFLLISVINSLLLSCADSSSTRIDHSHELLQPSLAPFNLHNSRVRHASGFLLTAFSNATPHTFFSVEHLSRRRVRKSTSVICQQSQ